MHLNHAAEPARSVIRRVLWAPLLLLVLVAGCAHYEPQPLVPAALASSFEARSFTDAGLLRYVGQHAAAGSSRANGWNLSTLTLAAFYFSPDLDVARARWGSARAAEVTAGQRPNPVLQLPFGYNSSAAAGTSPYLYGLALDIPIETAGKRGYRVARAGQLSDAAQAQIGAVAWQVRDRLRSALLDLYTADREGAIYRQQASLQQRILTLMEQRLRLGAASGPEVALARANWARTRIGTAQAASRAQAARAAVASAIGVPLDALDNLAIGFDTFDQALPGEPDAEVRRQALVNRADLRAALATYEASQAALQLEIARQYPDIHIGPGYTFDAGQNKFSLSVSGISLPVFNRNEGPIAEAQARRKEAAAQFTALQAQAIVATEQAVQAYRSAQALLTLGEGLQTAAERALRSAGQAFDSGETDRLALLAAQSSVEASRLARTQAWVAVQRAVGQSENALQRPLDAADAQVLRPVMESPL
ncbi:TolC family protein [Polaromonas sp.]|uniref:TolC family protein n=1 Tax=Polaromonas sp. TaxID=1869339 RepID=UPI002B525C0D|nr:TolC family protein [Polaromonas sp.]HQS30995.1 TolC family protein [Polaromonas sp.]